MEKDYEMLAKLVVNYAKLADEVKELKRLGHDAWSRCEGIDYIQECGLKHYFGEKCLDTVMREFRDLDPYDEIGYEEFYSECVAQERVCEWCIAGRSYKARRVIASRKLGHVRSIITKLGRKLAAEGVTA